MKTKGKFDARHDEAVVLTRFGGPDAFELQTLPVPPVGARQVRVRVHATAINPLDIQICRGDYADSVPLLAGIGHDVSGAEVTEFAPGDEVYYTPRIFESSAAPGLTPRSMSPTSISSAASRAT